MLTERCPAQSNKVSDSNGDKKEGLHTDGGAWGFKVSDQTSNADSTYILLIGDSILHGYGDMVKYSLANDAVVDFWMTGKHLNSEGLIEELQDYVSRRNYAVIHFNIGLHGWQQGRIPEGKYVPLLERYVQTIKNYAPQAKLIWASITPVTAQGVAELNKEINPTIVKRNALADEVMKRNNVVVNDLYSVVVNRLDLARLDRFHWNASGYQLMKNQIIKYIKDEIKY
ncbi:SGNH/GDSL hydrolase family protein [Arenibacter sp. F20364]|jgi:lysophospholipase L1-like esterase|uniref:SGNH/GDSL hydrolase family protein n=1 Tax=Arenibacter sp. F20364 TaxID=2926415 RepID=UPI001FF37A86|nr:SGNH/GDSL hydrolase family protein [Arenibacter sp. F20364]MCK0190682.1 SGNH/GDSL hydrolase family protein [Arenibacter sp. F20364]